MSQLMRRVGNGACGKNTVNKGFCGVQHQGTLNLFAIGGKSMKNNDYQEAALRTASSNFNVPPADLLHAILGLMTEVGELADILKKWVYYNEKPTEFDVVHIIEETGDLLWYIPLICRQFGINIGSVMDKNIAKLYARYPEKFTPEAAADRDLSAERQVLCPDKAQKYRLRAYVWQDGSGWQPHNIVDRTAESAEEATLEAGRMVDNGDRLGEVIVTITAPDGSITKVD